MKVLIVDHHNPQFTTFPEYVEYAFRSLGHDVKCYDYRAYIIPGRLRSKFKKLQEWDSKRISRGLLSAADDFRPDLVLVFWGGTIYPNTIKLLKFKHGCATVNWFSDFPGAPGVLERGLSVASAYDYFFCQSTDALEIHRQHGNLHGDWLPAGFDPDIHRPVESSQEKYKLYSSEVCFAGSFYPERADLFSRLVDFNLAIHGPGWEERLHKESPLRKFVRSGAVTPYVWTKIISAACIVLHYEGCGGYDWPEDKHYQVSPRVYETLGCGAFLICDAKRDLLAQFKPGEHLVTFTKRDEIVLLVKRYLDMSKERKRIAQNGRQEVLSKHTYKHRVEEMLRVLKSKGIIH